MDSLRALRVYAEGKQSDQSSDALELIGLLLSAIILAHGKKLQASIPIDRWRREAAAYESLERALPDWLDFVEESMKMGPLPLLTALRDESAPEEMRVVAALIVSANDEPNAEDRFAAPYLTVTNLYVSWLPDVEEYMIQWFVRVGCAWHRPSNSRFAPFSQCGENYRCMPRRSCAGLRKAARVCSW